MYCQWSEKTDNTNYMRGPILASSLHKLMNGLYIKYPRQSGKCTKHRCVFGLLKIIEEKLVIWPLYSTGHLRSKALGHRQAVGLAWKFFQKDWVIVKHNVPLNIIPQKCANWLSWFIINLVYSFKNIPLLSPSSYS